MWLISYRRVACFRYSTGAIKCNAPHDETILIDMSPEEWLLEIKQREEEVRNIKSIEAVGTAEEFLQVEIFYFAREIDDEVAEQLDEFF